MEWGRHYGDFSIKSSPGAILKEGESEDWDRTVTKPKAGLRMRSTLQFWKNSTEPKLPRRLLTLYSLTLSSLRNVSDNLKGKV